MRSDGSAWYCVNVLAPSREREGPSLTLFSLTIGEERERGGDGITHRKMK